MKRERSLLMVLISILVFIFTTTAVYAGGPGGAYNVKILSPAGGEEWVAGNSHEIIWSLIPSDALVSIYYVKSEGGWWQTIVKNYPLYKLSYLWDIPKDFEDGKYVIWLAVTIGKTTIYKSSYPFSVVMPPVLAQRTCIISKMQILGISDVQNDAYVGVNLMGDIDGQTREIYALAPFFFAFQISNLQIYGGRVLSVALLEFSAPDNIADPCGIEPESVGSVFYIAGVVVIDLRSSYFSEGLGKSSGKSSGVKNSLEMLLPQK